LPDWVRQWSAAEGGMAVNQAAARESKEDEAALKDG
jgi:hypothetical protein